MTWLEAVKRIQVGAGITQDRALADFRTALDCGEPGNFLTFYRLEGGLEECAATVADIRAGNKAKTEPPSNRGDDDQSDSEFGEDCVSNSTQSGASEQPGDNPNEPYAAPTEAGTTVPREPRTVLIHEGGRPPLSLAELFEFNSPSNRDKAKRKAVERLVRLVEAENAEAVETLTRMVELALGLGRR